MEHYGQPAIDVIIVIFYYFSMNIEEYADLTNSSVDPSLFTDSFAYTDAMAKSMYNGLDPVDPREAVSCLRDDVTRGGGINSGTKGICPVSECRLLVDKHTLSCEGFCLKSVVGVRKSAKPQANPKF